MDNEKDIFDKIMALPFLNKFYTIYSMHKEMLLYLFFGGVSYLLTMITFGLFVVVMKIPDLTANVISWIIVVAFCFFTNSKFVFRASDKTSIFKQLILFYASRSTTLVTEEIILFIFIEKYGLNSMIVKALAQIVVIIFNYVFSKLVIFKNSAKK